MNCLALPPHRIVGMVLLLLLFKPVITYADSYDVIHASKHSKQLTVEIAENPFRFSFDTTGPVFEDGTPAYGNHFVTQGYIYPVDTLEGGDSGVNADGSPLYPDQVLGEWTCRGVFVGDGFATVSGPIVNTTQLFSFYPKPGYDPNKLGEAASLVTEGFELADVGVPVKRAITGGTQQFQRAKGEARQTLLGISEQFGVSLKVRFRVRP